MGWRMAAGDPEGQPRPPLLHLLLHVDALLLQQLALGEGPVHGLGRRLRAGRALALLPRLLRVVEPEHVALAHDDAVSWGTGPRQELENLWSEGPRGRGGERRGIPPGVPASPSPGRPQLSGASPLPPAPSVPLPPGPEHASSGSPDPPWAPPLPAAVTFPHSRGASPPSHPLHNPVRATPRPAWPPAPCPGPGTPHLRAGLGPSARHFPSRPSPGWQQSRGQQVSRAKLHPAGRTLPGTQVPPGLCQLSRDYPAWRQGSL